MNPIILLIHTLPHTLSRILPAWFIFNYGFAWFQFVHKNKRPPKDYIHKDSTLNVYFFSTMIRRPSALKEVCTDKEYSKIFAKGICPSIEIPQTIAVIDLNTCPTFESFEQAIVPYQKNHFVLKPTHSSGSVLFLDKSTDRQKLHAFYTAAKENYFFKFREAQYARLQKKVLIEENIAAASYTHPLNDFKFYCSRGEVLFCEVHVHRFADHQWYCYSIPDFRIIEVDRTNPYPKERIKKPAGWKKMLSYASALSKQYDFVRIDLYDAQGKIYFGEFTFSPGAAISSFMNDDFERGMMRRIGKIIRAQKMPQLS
jgi:hypothetical protein